MLVVVPCNRPRRLRTKVVAVVKLRVIAVIIGENPPTTPGRRNRNEVSAEADREPLLPAELQQGLLLCMEETDKGITDFAQTVAGCVSFSKRLESTQVLLPDCQVIPTILCVNDLILTYFAVIIHGTHLLIFWHQDTT